MHLCIDSINTYLYRLSRTLSPRVRAMQLTQHSTTRCRIYVHPAACTSRASVEDIQRSTGLLVIINNPQRIALTTKHAETPAPLGGDAA